VFVVARIEVVAGSRRPIAESSRRWRPGERAKIIHDLRKGVHDVLIGVGLLREGLDLPEVSLVAILDAD